MVIVQRSNFNWEGGVIAFDTRLTATKSGSFLYLLYRGFCKVVCNNAG